MLIQNYFNQMQDWCFSLQEKVSHTSPTDKKLVHLITCMQLTKEVTEVLDCVPWKFEREMSADTREHLLEEMADVFNYFMKLMWVHGITIEEFYPAWEKKCKIIEERLLS